MLYTELLRLWDDSVKAVDAKDWQGALAKLDQITEPTSRTLFNTASVHLALGQLEPAIRALDSTIAKDERLSVGFFQRAGAHMQANRLEEALSDCLWAQKHMRGNQVVDYKQLGLHYKLYSWQVLYNAAAVHSRMGQFDQARDLLLSASQEKGAGRGGTVELALDIISRAEVPAPLMVPEGEVFRPRKQDVEQLQQRDFLGQAKVITSVIPNDDFGGFEPLRMQKPGYYEPKVDGSGDSHYMSVRSHYMARGPGQLTVPGGSLVFFFSEVDRDGMATVIHDGQKGLIPMTLLDPVDIKSKVKKTKKGIPSGIPLPPGLKPPTRPHIQTAPPEPPQYSPTAYSPTDQFAGSEQGDEAASVVVKVHYRFTIALSVPVDTPYHELRERVAGKLGQPASHLRLRHRQQGSQVLKPLDREEELQTLLGAAEAGRATLWCQTEDPLANRTILYQMVALYDFAAEGPEDLEFSEGDTIDILSEVNEEWLEGHCSGQIGIFPRSFAYKNRESPNV
ncbi:NADPH oxidase activator 1 [Aplochiton taeniatus]